MDERFDVSRLLALRKLTRAVAGHLEGQVKAYLAVMTPLFNPRSLLGEYIRGESKRRIKGADKALLEIKGAFKALQRSSKFNLDEELRTPLDVFGASPEVSPKQYVYLAQANGTEKTVTVTSPLTWVLSYSGLGPGRVAELLRSQGNVVDPELQNCVMHYLVMQIIAAKQPGLATVLEGLRFHLSVGHVTAFASLPMIHIAAPITTVRPPDGIIIESTEISGAPVFEEVVDLEQLGGLRDPMKQQLMALVEAQSPELFKEVAAS